ncbi:hypothetical protein ABFS82_04G013300 [Erythranthe guttata]|uniref:RING-type E3 ubiquitin transferase n=1 Tax=Erythranthe guttata TaxID=4155 RepID=A0A022S462_ERYGU|nr:PREDICTED: RING-H2 finger protein ATL64 [Erythranthe guttata]EYU46743.1 hypothetical protein MIMGU_mgv1a017988mg [Erythranthe guttata]|eukprot:XP_012833738.1 PREDICTED: RING-H2 finger protein ATL64 [Erythranthe guttata]
MDEENQDSNGYVSNGKIMISSIAILFLACFIVVSFHVYARWFRRRPVNHRRVNATSTGMIFSQGLDLRVMNSLPTFIYESKGGQESPLECAVCLSEFEDDETGRVLPDCKHCFHVDCIDMWLQCHRDCPLCRAQVKFQPGARNPIQPIQNPDQIILSIYVLEDAGSSGSNTELHHTCENDGILHTVCSSSSPTLDVTGQLPGQTGQDPTKIEGVSNLDPNIGPDIESGPNSTVRVLKRLFSI